jgi:hypothetical protein
MACGLLLKQLIHTDTFANRLLSYPSTMNPVAKGELMRDLIKRGNQRNEAC